MIDLQETIEFYRNLAKETSVRDSKDFYVQVAYWLEDYKAIKDRSVKMVESKMQCSCCGSKDLYDAELTVDSFGKTSLIMIDTGDGENESVTLARCCRKCGNIMPYVRIR